MKNYEEDHPDAMSSYLKLAQVYQYSGQFKPTKELKVEDVKDLASDKKNYGEDHIDIAINYFNLAIIYEDLGQLELSKKLMKKAYEIALKVLDPFYPLTIKFKSNLDSLNSM